MRRRSSHVVPFFLMLVAGCSIPSRDNRRDPANIPDPPVAEVEIRVDSFVTSVGQRHASWEFDATASDAPNRTCFAWAISNGPADSPTDIADEDWTELVAGVDAPCDTPEILVTTSGNDLMEAALETVADFDNGTPFPDGTGFASRWVRLALETPSGGRATAFKPINIYNTVSEVRLGPDRRTAPGGRWWLSGDAQRFTNTIIGTLVDETEPDPLFVRWRVNGELAARLDLTNEFGATGAATDGYVDTGFYDESSLRIDLPMSIDPSLNELTIEVADVDVPGSKTATDTIRADVVTSLWAYTETTGHLRRLDTSQFLGGFTEQFSALLASNDDTLFWARSAGTQIDLFRMDRGLAGQSASDPFELTIPEFATAAFNERMAAAPRADGGWWLQDGQEGRLYRIDANLTAATKLEDIFTVVVGPALPDFKAAGSGFYSALAAGGAGRVWIAGGEPALAGQRVLLVRPDATNGVGNALVIPPVDPFPDATEVQHLAPDGAGGVWVGSLGDAKLARVAINATNQVTVTQITIPVGCASATESIRSMASDPSRSALWIVIQANDPDTDRLCRLDVSVDPPTAVPQIADKFEADVIAVHPVDGSVYLSANNGTGLNRYAASNGASLEYLPLQAGAPGAPGVSAKSATFLGHNLLVGVNQTGPSSYDNRALIVEAAERFQPNDIDLEIDPYVMAFEQHVVDPVTGFVFVWLPDIGRISAFAPDQSLVGTIEVGYSEFRAQLAFDPDSRRLWFAFSDLWTGNRLPVTPPGRLLYADIPLEIPFAIEMEEVPGVVVAMARGMAVVPSSALAEGGRLCLAADFATEAIPEARVRTREADGTDTGEAFYTLDSGQDIETWITPDPTTGECWAGERGSSSEFVRLRPNESALSIASGFDIREAVMVSPGVVYGMTTTSFDELVLLDADSTEVTVDDPVFDAAYTQFVGQLRNGAVDPYWGHVWFGIDDGDGNVIRMTVGLGPHEAWREQGVYSPRIDNGR